ncbi:MAG: DNA-3-methyladenine glycosylase [Silvibacterium sp.]
MKRSASVVATTRQVAKSKILPRRFYADAPDVVARGLLGKVLARRLDGELLTGRIVETEAYFGQDDPAAHTFAGKTARNAVLFGPPGFAYVYFIYGMHYCLNVSCEPDGQAGGVLFRALEPLAGLTTMARLRGLPVASKPQLLTAKLTSGPGRLCQALAITRAGQNGLDVTSAESELQILDDGFQPGKIVATPRIGIRKAVDRPHRFVVLATRGAGRTGNGFA